MLLINFNNAYHLITDKLELWVREFIRLLPNLVIAALVLTVGLYASKFIRNLAGKLFKGRRALHNLFTNTVYVSFVLITLFVTLSILQLDKAVTSLLAGAGIIGLALAFAFQDIVANFVAGIFMSFTRPMELGHIVKVGDYMGKVEDIRLRDTLIRTFQGQIVVIPNKEIFQNPIENFSLLGKRRLDLSVGISYGDDLEKVKRVTLEAVNKITVRAEEDEITLFFKEFGDSSINFEVRIWVNSPEQPVFLQGMSEAVMNIKKAYDENDIMIPFPIRTLDFGIKGGAQLAEQLVNVRIKDGTQN